MTSRIRIAITCALLAGGAAQGQVPAPTPNAQPAGHIPVPKAGDPFFAPVTASGVPQTFHQRFSDYAVAAFGPRVLMGPAFAAGFTMLHPPAAYPHDWKDGAGAYGRIYGSSMAIRTSVQTARFLTAAALHEDFRYRPSSSRNALVRSLHAVAFTFVDKSDGGHDTLAVSNFAAAAADAFTPKLYLPAAYDTTSRTDRRLVFAFVGFAARNLSREFAPDLFRATHKMHLPFPRVPIPAWWTHNTP
jgi:hypothetical protein